MAKASTKKSTKTQQKSKKVRIHDLKIIAFCNGKILTSKDYPPVPEAVFLYEHDYEWLMKAQEVAKLPPSDLDVAAQRIAKYREREKERLIEELIPQADRIVFGLRSPRRAKRKIKPGEEYKLVPFRNGYITRTKFNHRPGTIFITLEEYNTLINALKAGDVQEHQLDELALMFTKIREPEEIEAIEEYQRKNPPPEAKAKKKKKAEDDRLFPVVNDRRIWDKEVENYKPEEILWLTGKELDIVWRNDFGRKGLKALLEVVKNYRLPLVDGRRIPKSKIEEYPASKIEYVRMKAYIEDKMPVPSIEEVINQQEPKIKALAKDIAQETAKRFVNEIIPESVSKHLSPEQIEVQKQDFAYGLSESLMKQFSWELSQARFEAKNNKNN